ncbi:MAG: hypothetical protein KGI02_06760 [Thaumarchaeota archaeon]|nr:hypothetical protein [Nitrososphaerota archaeon]MDE1840391.1 hypothetical protein [Nitrososphaerota archaeon]
MFKYEEDVVNISKLKPCPVKVTLHTEKMLKDLTSIVKTNPGQIEPIVVAILGSEQYITNGDLRVKAFENAGKDSIKAWCINVKTISDVVRLHMELNTHGSINPIKMAEAVSYLEKHNVVPSVDKRYLELAKKTLYPKVRQEWDDFVVTACQKHPNVEIPMHVIEKIADFSTEKEQLTATTVILDTVRALKPNRFVFPAPPALEVILSSLSQKHSEKEMIVFEPPESEKKDWKKPDMKEAENLIRGSSHNSLVHCKCGRDLLLDTKTHRVSNVNFDKENQCIKLVDGDGQAAYVVPPTVIEFLNVEDGQSLRVVTINGSRELEKFAKSLKSGSFRMVVVTCN